MSSRPESSTSPTPWFDKFVAGITAHQLRTVTAPDGRSHLSVIMRSTSIAEAFTDARRVLATPSLSISPARDSRAIEQASVHEY